MQDGFRLPAQGSPCADAIDAGRNPQSRRRPPPLQTSPGRRVHHTHQPRPRACAVRPRSFSMPAALAAPTEAKKPGEYQRPIRSRRTSAAASPDTSASVPILSGSSGGSVPSGQASPSVHIHGAGPLPPAVECVGSFSRRRSTARRKVSRCTLRPTSMRRTCAVQRPAVTVPCSRLRVGGAAVGQRPGHAGRVDTGVPEQPAGQQRSRPRRTPPAHDGPLDGVALRCRAVAQGGTLPARRRRRHTRGSSASEQQPLAEGWAQVTDGQIHAGRRALRGSYHVIVPAALPRVALAEHGQFPQPAVQDHTLLVCMPSRDASAAYPQAPVYLSRAGRAGLGRPSGTPSGRLA